MYIILLNGACGIGKSTIAKLLHQRIEFSFLRDKDVQRRNISNYKKTLTHQNKSRGIILSLTKHIIEFCIENDMYMIFDGVLINELYIKNLQNFISYKGGKLIHIYLNAPKEIWSNRLINRGIGGSLTYEKAEFFYDSLVELNKKIKMIEIDTSITNEENVCKEIINFINS